MKTGKFVKIIILSALIFLLALLFLWQGQKKPAPLPLKDTYSTDEIITAIQKNYTKIRTIMMTFSDTWIDQRKINNPFNLHIPKAKLYHTLLDNRLKIKTKGLELSRDKKFKIWGNYKTKTAQKKYYHLINWLISVYETALLLPLKLDYTKIKEVSSIIQTRLKEKGYYALSFSLKQNKIQIDLHVNMRFGTVEKLKIIEKIEYKDEKNRKVYYSYIIQAELNDITESENIFFPQAVQVKYMSRYDKFQFKTRIKKIKINKRIADKNLVLQNKKNKITWYNDPYWLNNKELILIRGAGREIKNVYGKIFIKDKDFYLIRRNIKNDREKIIKHLFSVKDEEYNTKFIFSADYNKKYNLLAYAIIPTDENTNPDIRIHEGLYLLYLENLKTIKISAKGFLPLWSGNEEHLIWNETQNEKIDPGVNNIWFLSLPDKKRELLIKNGFYYTWGKEDQTIIFEKGYWIYKKGNKRADRLSSEKGLFIYNLSEQKQKQINEDGCYPHLSEDKEKVIFSVPEVQNSIYICNLNNLHTTEILKRGETDEPLKAYWFNHDQDILFIKTTGPSIEKHGLYKYSLKNKTYEFLSNRIGLKGKFDYYLDPSPGNQTLLYKLYIIPDYRYTSWGIFNFNNKKIQLEDNSFL